MLTKTYHNVHHYFKLNGCHFDKKELGSIAYSYVKEGDIYQKAIGEFLLDWFDNKDYIVVKTSGSTGFPKEVRLQKQAMIESALATGAFFGLNPGDKALHCLSTQFIAGKMMLVRSLILGLDVDIVMPSLAPLAQNTTNYDFVAMVPLQVQNSLKELKYIKKLIVGGAKIDTLLVERLLPLKTKIYETYGMTETITHIAAKQLGEQAFSILPNVTISQDARKCLVISVPAISDEPIVTNDLVELKNNKQFVFIGRIDNIINSGGVKLIPEQIEEKLIKKMNARFFVTGIPDIVLGEKLILVVEGNKQNFAPDFFDNLRKHEKPKEIIFVPKFKETGSGKVLRKESLKL